MLLKIVVVPLFFAVVLLWAFSDPEIWQALEDAPTTGRDFVTILLVVLVDAFDVFAPLCRTSARRRLPLVPG